MGERRLYRPSLLSWREEVGGVLRYAGAGDVPLINKHLAWPRDGWMRVDDHCPQSITLRPWRGGEGAESMCYCLCVSVFPY